MSGKDDLMIQDYKNLKEYSVQFFQHWSLLAAGTLTLLIPFVTSIGENIVGTEYLWPAEVLLVISAICSAGVIYIEYKISWHALLIHLKEKNNNRRWLQIKKWIGGVAAGSLILGIGLVVCFVNLNLIKQTVIPVEVFAYTVQFSNSQKTDNVLWIVNTGKKTLNLLSYQIGSSTPIDADSVLPANTSLHFGIVLPIATDKDELSISSIFEDNLGHKWLSNSNLIYLVDHWETYTHQIKEVN